MIAALFPLFTPVTDRLIGRYVPAIVPLVPRIGGSPVLPTAGFLLADVMLIALSVWDWRTNQRRVFPIALVVLVLYHASVLTFYQFGFWRAFGEWFVAGEEEEVGVPAIGITGPGPDRVVIPPDATPGTWRVCTADAGENVCVRIEITSQ